jgi:DNA polymerase III sliding clamp (beta) subunit (PCNA family)
MIVTSLVIILAFLWLLRETDWLRIRLPVGAISIRYDVVFPYLPDNTETNPEHTLANCGLVNTLIVGEYPYKPLGDFELSDILTSGNTNIICKRTPNCIRVLRENLIKTLTSIKDDNISIADVGIQRKKLLEILKLLTEDIITINFGTVSWREKYKAQDRYRDNAYIETEVNNESCIQVTCGRDTMRFLNKPNFKHGVTTLKALNFIDAEAYVKPESQGIPLDVKELINALNFVIPCVATEQLRPVLTCILFDSENDTLRLVSADGFRLGKVSIPAKGIPTDKVLIYEIPKLLTYLKSIKPTGRGRNKYYPDVYLSYTETTVVFSSDNGTIELEKFDGKFPAYEQLIPDKGTKVEFISNDMLQASKALESVANNGSGIIRLQFKTGYPVGKVTLSAFSDEFGELKVECDAIVESDCRIACNVKYIIQLLNQCKNVKMSLKLIDTSSPMKFEVDNKVCVVMPMFVQWEEIAETSKALVVIG